MTRESKLQTPSHSICMFPSAGVGSAEWSREEKSFAFIEVVGELVPEF